MYSENISKELDGDEYFVQSNGVAIMSTSRSGSDTLLRWEGR
jgi:hypothetical protein